MFFGSHTTHKSCRSSQSLSLETLDERIVPSSTPVAPVPASTVNIGSATSGQVVAETNGVSQYGVGSWIKVVTQDSTNQETVTTITSYSGGVQVIDTDLITKNSTTGVTIDDHTITTTSSAGSQTVTHDYKYTPEASGLTEISEVFTDAKGKVTTYTGSETTSTTSYGTETEVTLTNNSGQKETYTAEHFSGGDATATETTGINFNGQAFNSATLRTYNGVTQTNALDSSINGKGSYTFSETKPISSQVVVQLDKSFSNGTTVDTTRTTTTDGANNTNVNVISDETKGNGKVTSSTSDVNVTSTKGTSQIAGSFSQSNGQWGLVVGSSAKTSFGSTRVSLDTDQHGVVKSITSEVLTIGDTQFQVSTGTDFSDHTVNLATLTTGIAVKM
jgi:hypothetical protein